MCNVTKNYYICISNKLLSHAGEDEARKWNVNKTKFIEMCNKFDYKHENGITIYDLYYNFIGEKGVINFDEYHCAKGELNWKGCRWVGYFNSSMRIPEFKKKLKDMFNIK